MKKFFYGMIAVLSVSFILIGCPTDAETETVTRTEMIHLDVLVGGDTSANTLTALRALLVDDGKPLSIGVANVTGGTLAVTTSALEIPAGKVVYLLNGTTLATATSNCDLEVEGIVYVGAGATLDTSDGKVKVPGEGRVYVVGSMAAGGTGGTLVIADPADVTDGTNPDTVLGTKVSIGNATLKAGSAVTLPDNDAVTAVLGYVGSGGTIDLSAATVTGSKPSTLAAISLGGKKLVVTAAENEDQTTLTVPAGLALTAKSDDTLASITGLTVNGSLTTAAGTLAGVTTLTVNGTLDAAKATLAAVTALTVNGTLTVGNEAVFTALATAASGTGSLTLGNQDFGTKAAFLLNIAKVTSAATTITADTLTVPAATTLTLTGAAAPTGDVTVNAAGTIIVADGGSLTPTTNKALTVNGALVIEGAGDVALTAATTKIVVGAGGVIDVKSAKGKLGESTQTDTKVTVGTTAAPTTATKATVADNGTTWTVTTDTTGSDGTVILGTLSLTVEGTSAVDGQTGADASGSAAAGKLVAGAGTTITFIGTN